MAIIIKMALKRRPYGYSKIEKEDPEERSHRRAQFLIYKALEKADSRRKPCCVRIRISKLRIKMKNRFGRIKKRVLAGVSAAGVGVHGQFKTLKQLFGPRQTIISLPPLFK